MRITVLFLIIITFVFTGCTARLKEEKAKCEAELRGCQDETAALKIGIVNFDNKLKQVEAEKAMLQADHAQLSKDYEELKKRKEQAAAVTPSAEEETKSEAEKSPKIETEKTGTEPVYTPQPTTDSGQSQKKSSAGAAIVPADDKKAEIAELNAAIAKLETRIKQLNSEIEAKDRAIAALKKEIKELAEKTQPLVEKDEKLKEMRKSVNAKFQDEIQKGDVVVVENTETIALRITEKILFNSGSAELNKKSKQALDKIAEIAKKSPDSRIRVEGHADSKSIGAKLAKIYPTNWELSSARAANVVKYLKSKGIDKKQMSVVGLADNAPIGGNDTKADREKNRRIEIVLIPTQGK